MCVCSDNMFISLYVSAKCAAPVAVYSVMFCIICSFILFVVDTIGDHIVV